MEKKKRRREWTGNTIPAAARRLKIGEGQLRRAIKNGEVKTVVFAGLERIVPSEIERIAALLGRPLPVDEEHAA